MTTHVATTPDAVTELSVREVRRSVLGRWGLRFNAVVGWAAFAAGWYALSTWVLGVQQLPPPHEVVREAWQVLSGGHFLGAFWASLARVMAGYAIALLVSVLFGLVIAYSNWWRLLLQSLIRLLLNIPNVVLAILALNPVRSIGYWPNLDSGPRSRAAHHDQRGPRHHRG